MSHYIATVLLQKNDKQLEQLIMFYNKGIKDDGIKYKFMEKHAYALVKALKYFKGYVL